MDGASEDVFRMKLIVCGGIFCNNQFHARSEGSDKIRLRIFA